MIVSGFGRYLSLTAHDHEAAGGEAGWERERVDGRDGHGGVGMGRMVGL